MVSVTVPVAKCQNVQCVALRGYQMELCIENDEWRNVQRQMESRQMDIHQLHSNGCGLFHKGNGYVRHASRWQ